MYFCIITINETQIKIIQYILCISLYGMYITVSSFLPPYSWNIGSSMLTQPSSQDDYLLFQCLFKDSIRNFLVQSAAMIFSAYRRIVYLSLYLQAQTCLFFNVQLPYMSQPCMLSLINLNSRILSLRLTPSILLNRIARFK